MAAFYALRLYQRTMHNRKPEAVESREIGLRDGLAIGALVACVIALALSPQMVLSDTETAAGLVGQLEDPTTQSVAISE